jgi:hypothetical protein
MLKEGDVIEIKQGMSVYTDNPGPERCVIVKGEFSYLAGRYVVYMTMLNGGGSGFPNGHHVYAQKINDPSVRIDFYQTGLFTAMIPDLTPIGRAACQWNETSL